MRYFNLTIDDIKGFLAEFNFNWSGKIYKPEKQSFEPANIEDINNKIVCLTNENNFIYAKINLHTFKIYTTDEDEETFVVSKDLSDHWIKYLLNKHGLDYARLLYSYCAKKCEIIEKDCLSKLDEIENRKLLIREQSKEKMKPYKRIQRDLTVLYGDKIDYTFTNFT